MITSKFKIVKYNHANGYYDLSELYEGNDKHVLGKDKKSALIVQEIENLLKLANIPKKLDVFNVKSTDLKGFNEFAKKAKGAFDFNPVKIPLESVAELFIYI